MIDKPLAHPLSSNTPGSYSASPSTTLERALLFITIVLLPFEDAVPTLGGLSIIAVSFGVMALFALRRTQDLLAISCRPVFLILMAMVAIVAPIELMHPDPSLGDWFRLAQVVVGAILIAVLVRDAAAQETALYGYLCVGLLLGVLFFAQGYQGLSEATAEGHGISGGLRSSLYSGSLVGAGGNLLANYAAQATLTSLSLAIGTGFGPRKLALLGSTLFLVISTFLTMSRGASVVCVLGIGTILVRWKGVNWRPVAIGLAIVLAGYWLIPEAAFSRQVYHYQKKETRSKIYQNALELLPEYATTGVGSGNYWSSWARENGFKRGRHVLGMHNSFLQVTMCWGVVPAGLLALGYALVCLSLPKRAGRGLDSRGLGLTGLAVGAGVFLWVSHVFYAKIISLAFGLIVGSRYWIYDRDEASQARPLTGAYQATLTSRPFPNDFPGRSRLGS